MSGGQCIGFLQLESSIGIQSNADEPKVAISILGYAHCFWKLRELDSKPNRRSCIQSFLYLCRNVPGGYRVDSHNRELSSKCDK
ncbi:hypothetical protein CEXT_765801 [Caerostris extrusa]|uniref:Uncharacterized protein n=1 Tax=Caerostris extrusa TaxID=172846 RepID=A0AAV4QLA4_CAEEX|nr:hypothetical protein CEXT_765801 [Caerostris extrusa]